MSKNKKESFLQSKQFKYGGMSILFTVLFIAIMIVFNMLIGTLNEKVPLQLDLTATQLFQLTDTSKQIIKDVKNEVTIYQFANAGEQNTVISNFLRQYDNASDKITYKAVDLLSSPTLASKFSTTDKPIDSNSVVVVTKDERNYKTFSASDLYVMQQSEEGTYVPVAFQAEQKITSALRFLSTGETPKVFFLAGHGEPALSDMKSAKYELEEQNYTVEEINLLKGDIKLTSDDVLIVVSPTSDLTEEERNTIKKFLSDGGKALFAIQPLEKDVLTNFKSLLQAYDVTLLNEVVVEGNLDNYYKSGIYTVPKMADNNITKTIREKNQAVILPVTSGMKISDVPNQNNTISVLFQSSDKSWSKKIVNAAVGDKADSDPKGPFVTGVTIDAKSITADGKRTRMVVLGSSAFMTEQNFFILQGNADLLINSVAWVRGEEQNVMIGYKMLYSELLDFKNEVDRVWVELISLAAIPLLVFAAGFVVWMKRRHL